MPPFPKGRHIRRNSSEEKHFIFFITFVPPEMTLGLLPFRTYQVSHMIESMRCRRLGRTARRRTKVAEMLGEGITLATPCGTWTCNRRRAIQVY
jgi:hypothetical protein